jgi:tRNA threonylcarbamoyladenosine biosynthesis protein TsaE
VEITLRKERDTIDLGAKIATALAPGDLVILSGDLGAGKTFLAGAIVHALGLAEEVPVTSPTFTLVQEYETQRGRVLHVDLYRLRNEAGVSRGAAEKGDERARTVREIARLGMGEARAEGAILLVEWGDDFEHELGGAAAVHIDLRIEQNVRKARIVGPKTSNTL